MKMLGNLGNRRSPNTHTHTVRLDLTCPLSFLSFLSALSLLSAADTSDSWDNTDSGHLGHKRTPSLIAAVPGRPHRRHTSRLGPVKSADPGPSSASSCRSWPSSLLGYARRSRWQ